MTIIKGWRAIAQTFGVTQAVAHGWREQGAPSSCFPAARKRRCPPPTSLSCGRGCPVGMAPPPLPPPCRHFPRQRRKPTPCRIHTPPHRNRLYLPTSQPPRRPRHAPTVEPRAWCGDTVTAGVASGATPSFQVPADGKRSGSEGSRALRTFLRRRQLPAATTGLFPAGVRTLVVTAHNFCMEHGITK